MLIGSQMSDNTCTTLYQGMCKWLVILIHRYRGVGDSWSLQCVAMCSVSLVSKHPSQLIDVVQPAGRSWPSDKSTLCIYDVYKWWQYESACKHFTFDILSVFVDMLVFHFMFICVDASVYGSYPHAFFFCLPWHFTVLLWAGKHKIFVWFGKSISYLLVFWKMRSLHHAIFTGAMLIKF